MQFKLIALPLCAAILAAGVWVARPSTSPQEASQTRPASPSSQLAKPKGPAVLTITGLAKGNVGPHTTKVDYATLDRLAQEQVTVYEPFLKQDVTFNAIAMTDFYAAAGIPSRGDLDLHALDDYHMELPITGVADGGYLATRVAGKRMAIPDGGPIRLIFAGGPIASNTDAWVWSIDSIKVR